MTEADMIRLPAVISARLAHLKLEGYRPEVFTPDAVSFHYRDAVYLLTADEGDPNYLRIAAPNIWSIEDSDERLGALETAAEVQWNLKAVKVNVTRDDTWVTVECFLQAPEAFAEVFDRALFAVTLGVRQFSELMRGRRQAATAEADEALDPQP